MQTLLNTVEENLIKKVKLFAFDLDGTLTESKTQIRSNIALLFAQLIKNSKVAIISGGEFAKISHQVLEHIEIGSYLQNLIIMPVSGTQVYQFAINDDNKMVWERTYYDFLTNSEKSNIKNAIIGALNNINLYSDYIIDDRQGQITVSLLGNETNIEIKNKFDPDLMIRNKICDQLSKSLSDLEIHPAGTTSIDITHKGVSKATAVQRLTKMLALKYSEIVYFGDKFTNLGNDYPVKELGIDCFEVKNLSDTERYLSNILDIFKVSVNK